MASVPTTTTSGSPHPNSHHHAQDDESLTPLEQEVLDEYTKVLENLNSFSALLADLAAKPSTQILESLRGLERKTSLVFTLLKASVYSIVLQQQILGDEADEESATGAE
ncbi:hypothetical protein P152DRAFT_392879 [Eremomyces bilateralis CBS 781.70]|uniref:DASH complex subunit DAD3 n=1 Tax=Eremomyces bilateralis CBS 781.70 TaxID=1392243 RepID=A0A6G1G8I2_9PEZI|nr:uncharacterized protein P152DRAFT_392879 [Eremomyces bilateralis CBS 781.70]KAF1814210.1 hypothetical protein P152DRAFT_392879 [Eremomyces bilateralis CBS 781.70]